MLLQAESSCPVNSPSALAMRGYRRVFLVNISFFIYRVSELVWAK